MTVSNRLRDVIRLDAWRSVFEKTDRILSGESVTVSITEDVPSGMEEVPGWTNGLNINLNAKKVREMVDGNDPVQAVLRLKGLNYHELSHVLYTPRMSDDLPRRIVKRAQETGESMWWYAFNALEDQRIETWFSSTYGVSRRYFEATVLEWIISNGSAESAVLLYGRKYLDPKIRVQAGKVFVKKYDQMLYTEFQAVIDEYVTLSMPEDNVKAWSLLLTYVDLLRKMQTTKGAPLPRLVMQDNGATGPSDPTRVCGAVKIGKMPSKAQRKAAQAKAADAVDAAQDADDEQTAQPDKGKSDSDGSGKDTGAVTDSDGDSTNAGGQGAAGADGTDTTLANDMDDLVNAAHNGMDEVKNDDQVLNDVDAALDAVKAAVENGKMQAEGMAQRAQQLEASSDALLAARKVQNILLRIRQEAEPETLIRQTNGRADARRIITRRPHETDLFKTWDSGCEDETGVEAVILIDKSGSMTGRNKEASAATWALKRSFDRLDIRATVLAFDTDYHVVYQQNDKAHPGQVPLITGHGGTEPSAALAQAQRIFAKSQAPNKVLITLTDGDWHGGDSKTAPILKQMTRSGVVSLLLGLDRAQTKHGNRGHLEGHDLEEVKDLPKAAVKLVSRIMRNALA